MARRHFLRCRPDLYIGRLGDGIVILDPFSEGSFCVVELLALLFRGDGMVGGDAVFRDLGGRLVEE